MTRGTSVPLPPQSIDAERAILGAILIEGAAGYHRLTSLVRPEQFLFEAHRDVFTAIMRLETRGEAIDLLTVGEELRHLGRLDASGGRASLARLVEEASILVNLPSYEKIVVEEATRRDYLALADRLRYGATNGTAADELVAMADVVLTEHRRGRRRRPDEAPHEVTALLAHRFPPRVDLIGRGVLPRRSMMVLGGRTFLGKSLLLDNLCLQRARGRAWLGFPTDLGVSLICSAEITLQGVQQRLATMLAADPDPLPAGALHVHDDRGIKLDTAAGLAMMSQWIEETGATILRLDPLAKYMSTEENSTRDMGRVVDALEALADRYNLGVIVVHHEGHAAKDSGRTGGDRLRGSTALYAAADTVAMLSKDGDGYRLEWELRHARTPEPVRLLRDARLWYDLAGISDEDKAVAKIVATIDMTYEGLVGAIQQDCGVSKSTAKRRLKAAVDSKAIEKVDGRYAAGPTSPSGMCAPQGSRVHEGSLGD
jgi:replicative DNA helicase